MTYEEYWKGRAQLERPRFKNYGVLCEVHHGEYGALQSNLTLARMFTKQRRDDGAELSIPPGVEGATE